MIKTISIATYNRPDNLAWLLQTLQEQLLPLDDYQLHISIDRGGGNFDAMREIAEAVDFIETHVTWPKKRLGVDRGTFESIRRPFEEAKSDFNVYLEEDFLLSPDALNLVEWFIENGDRMRSLARVNDIAAYCLCNLAHEDGASPTEVFLKRGGGLWGFVLSRRQWDVYIKPGWLMKRPREKGKRIFQTWDKQLAVHIRTFPGVYRAFPALSRTSNSGKTRMCCIPGKEEYVYDEELGVHKFRYYNQERKAHAFRFVGIND